MQSDLFFIKNRKAAIVSTLNKDQNFHSHNPIEILVLNDSNVNDVALEFVANNFRSLKALHLSNCKFIDDRALANITGRKLTPFQFLFFLILIFCNFIGLTLLEHLDLSKCCKLSNFGLAYLQSTAISKN
jgi:hypothetical protein